MTKYYLDLDLLRSYYIYFNYLHLITINEKKAVKVTNNYLIRFVDSSTIYSIIRMFVENLETACYIDDERAHQKIIVFNDGDLYLLENK